ncbi:trimeric intracellular cation channel family protein [Paraburkholderia sediminicola]|uniref:Trimeric intracellular cation channel family protein n=1 Tax=Paraburkholderia rhynchosiae TaxID=487049 RepID=A0ACC7N5E2_9BURK
MSSHIVYQVLDLVGTFVFAISGAVAARQRRLDLFGILSVAFVVACGGGIVRDVCIGATPPAALSDWRYLATSMLASAVTIAAYAKVRRLRFPVLFFDAVGLGLFAVSGAQKSLTYGHNAELAILLGTVSAVGGGVIRDMLLSRVPSILEREIYASAALLGALVFVVSAQVGAMSAWTPWVATAVCVGVRLLALYYGWRLPVYRGTKARRADARTRTNAL